MKTKKIVSSLLLAAILTLPVIAMATTSDIRVLPPTGYLWPAIKNFVFGTLYTIGIAIIVIMILVAGVMFITAAGNPEKVQTARQTLLYAVVGGVVLLLAGSIFTIIESWLG